MAKNYQELTDELDVIIASMQRDDADIDEALKAYKRGLEITKQLEVHLTEAKNTITEIKAAQ